jgi:ectoine hydroxylase-related dioxygenase (phytanoyl-CoA dioxygenase family)
VHHPSFAHRRIVHDTIALFCRAQLQDLLADYKLCIANFLLKEPGRQQSRVPMHVDWSFVDERNFPSVNVWYPLTDVTETNGFLRVVTGSEHYGVLVRPYAGKWLAAHPFHEVLPLLTQTYAQALPIPAGHAVIYHARLLHGSGPNVGLQRRVAIGCALAPSEASILHAVLLSPTEAELFEVSPDFFCSYMLDQRPQGVRSLGTVPHFVKQLAAEDVMRSPHLRPSGRR